jgi:hypothetical protein
MTPTLLVALALAVVRSTAIETGDPIGFPAQPLACSLPDASGDWLVPVVEPVLPATSESRSLRVAVEAQVNGTPALFQIVAADRPATPARPRRLEYSGRAWPFAVAAAADAATTYWALGRGGLERNPLLGRGGMDVAMVKIVQFPLLAMGVKAVEDRHPRMGRHLRWVTLAFHAALAFNNVRKGLALGQGEFIALRRRP